MVTTWKIINYEKGKSNHCKNIQSLRIDISAQYIISPLTCICNAIQNSSTFPDRLKYTLLNQFSKKVTKK